MLAPCDPRLPKLKFVNNTVRKNDLYERTEAVLAVHKGADSRKCRSNIQVWD